MTEKLPLSKPLKTHDGEVSELTLRELTAADIVQAKSPPLKFITQDGEQVAEYRYDVIMQLAVKATGIDDIVLGRLAPKDFHALSSRVVGLWNASGE